MKQNEIHNSYIYYRYPKKIPSRNKNFIANKTSRMTHKKIPGEETTYKCENRF